MCIVLNTCCSNVFQGVCSTFTPAPVHSAHILDLLYCTRINVYTQRWVMSSLYRQTQLCHNGAQTRCSEIQRWRPLVNQPDVLIFYFYQCSAFTPGDAAPSVQWACSSRLVIATEAQISDHGGLVDLVHIVIYCYCVHGQPRLLAHVITRNYVWVLHSMLRWPSFFRAIPSELWLLGKTADCENNWFEHCD